MKCDICDSEATVFLTQIIDGKMTQVNLCDKCSREQGVTDPTGFKLADFLIGAEPKKSRRSYSRDDDSLACPACGFTRAHLKKIGRMGCPECYQVFADDLESMLRAMHKGTRHVGKSPSTVAESSPEPSSPVGKMGQMETGTVSGSAPTAVAPQISPPMPPPLKPPPPPAPPTPAQLKRKLAELKTAIDQAVADERYEDAAKLRDQMKEIEAKLA